jgi:single-stranded-DNA-specific exonuclease
MTKQWIINNPETDASELAASLGLHPLVARILVARGFADQDSASAFLSPSLASLLDPFGLIDMDKGVERLVLARKAKEQVCIYGDYDVDGVTATALMITGLTALGINAVYHIPNRIDDGYGLNSDALNLIHQSGSHLVISVDCGVTALAEAEFCRRIGLDLIITDHHQPFEQLPDAVAVINPNRSDCGYQFKGLAGVGVAFALLVALRSRLRQSGVFDKATEPDLRQFLDLVALGTIADMVPLVGQNRILVTSGLQRMRHGCRTGLAALKQVAGVKDEVSCGQVGFRLGPRLNAAGRLESAVPGVELLLSADPVKAHHLADELDSANSERQELEAIMVEEAVAMVEAAGGVDNRFSIVLASENWHPGVVGIVASRIAERYHRPAIIIAVTEDGAGKGSGRSITGFHLLDALHASSSLLERFGGHRAAAGITIKADNIEEFAAQFEKAAAARLTTADLVPSIMLDAEAQADQVNMALARDLAKLAPFGMGNPEPVLCLRNLKLIESRTVGGSHLKLRLGSGHHHFNAIGWRLAGTELADHVDLAFCCEIDSWGGGERLQLRIRDIRPTEVGNAA